jgi:hypothetical protein
MIFGIVGAPARAAEGRAVMPSRRPLGPAVPVQKRFSDKMAGEFERSMGAARRTWFPKKARPGRTDVCGVAQFLCKTAGTAAEK